MAYDELGLGLESSTIRFAAKHQYPGPAKLMSEYDPQNFELLSLDDMMRQLMPGDDAVHPAKSGATDQDNDVVVSSEAPFEEELRPLLLDRQSPQYVQVVQEMTKFVQSQGWEAFLARGKGSYYLKQVNGRWNVIFFGYSKAKGNLAGSIGPRWSISRGSAALLKETLKSNLLTEGIVILGDTVIETMVNWAYQTHGPTFADAFKAAFKQVPIKVAGSAITTATGIGLAVGARAFAPHWTLRVGFGTITMGVSAFMSVFFWPKDAGVAGVDDAPTGYAFLAEEALARALLSRQPAEPGPEEGLGTTPTGLGVELPSLDILLGPDD